jgi:hypothetical protein
MLRFATLAAAALLMAVQASPPAPPQLPSQLLAVLDDVQAARAFDYMALKAEGADLRALSDAVYRRTTPPGGGNRRCLTPAEAEVRSSLIAAIPASDAAAFDDDRAAAAEAWGRWSLFAEGMANGHVATEPPFSWVSERYAGAGAATDPRVRELLTRTARDQLIRRAFDGGPQVWGALSPGAKERMDTRLSLQMCETDGENTVWLKADIAANGWYLISTTGEDASKAAWLMAQHADRDPAFQKHVLSILEPLVVTGEASAANFAYLWDRVAALSDHRPQRFGTQGRCVAKNVWAPFDLEDPDRVEALRAEADIGSLAEYAAHMGRYCADFAG